jgi:hypothetical protein
MENSVKLPPISLHPEGVFICGQNTDDLLPIEVDTFDGKVGGEWDPYASVSPFGQLTFSSSFSKQASGLNRG